MRRLPVFFLMDVSESMVGEPIKAVERGLEEILRELRSDPYALETVHVSVLVFAGKAEVAEKLTELVEFRAPKLPIGGGTSLGAGLDLLMKEIEREVKPTTSERKGDWKPLVFLFTDGAPTDDPKKSVERWNRDFRKRANMVAVSFGDHADMRVLGALTEDALLLKDADGASFREFFKWVSASIQASSMAVSEGMGDEKRLGRVCGINLEKGDPERAPNVDENYVILASRCTKEKKLYLAKFAKSGSRFRGEGAWVVDEERYRKLGGAENAASSVEAEILDDVPACPVCGDEGLAHCGCGGLACYGGQHETTCPWCGTRGAVGAAANFSIDRARG